jgi:hypothetical protein
MRVSQVSKGQQEKYKGSPEGFEKRHRCVASFRGNLGILLPTRGIPPPLYLHPCSPSSDPVSPNSGITWALLGNLLLSDQI